MERKEGRIELKCRYLSRSIVVVGDGCDGAGKGVRHWYCWFWGDKRGDKRR